MNLTFDIEIVDAKVALRALKQYEEGNFGEAIRTLLEILDLEPKNWQARLMLAVCYYKTKQFISAERTFRFIYDQASERDLRKRGLEGLQATKAKLERNQAGIPAEIASYFECNTKEPFFPWLDGVTNPSIAPRRAWKPSYSH